MDSTLEGDSETRKRAKAELRALSVAYNSLSEYRSVLHRQSKEMRAQEWELSQQRRSLNERRVTDATAERQSLVFWKHERELNEDRQQTETRKYAVQRQLNELNEFRMDLHLKKSQHQKL